MVDWSLLIQALLSLLAVVALIGVIAWLMRRVGMGGMAAAPRGQEHSCELRIFAQIHTSPRHRIAVIAAAQRLILVSITPSGSTFLCDVTPCAAHESPPAISENPANAHRHRETPPPIG